MPGASISTAHAGSRLVCPESLEFAPLAVLRSHQCTVTRTVRECGWRAKASTFSRMAGVDRNRSSPCEAPSIITCAELRKPRCTSSALATGVLPSSVPLMNSAGTADVTGVRYRPSSIFTSRRTLRRNPRWRSRVAASWPPLRRLADVHRLSSSKMRTTSSRLAGCWSAFSSIAAETASALPAKWGLWWPNDAPANCANASRARPAAAVASTDGLSHCRSNSPALSVIR
jgi:hypothetical protein